MREMARMGKWMLAVCAWLGGMSVQAADAVLEGTRLFIPTVNTQREVAKYQNAVFTHVGGAEWRLLSFDEIGVGGRSLVRVEQVYPEVTDTQPAHVLLRATGGRSGCGESELSATHRRNGDRFTVVISYKLSPSLDVGCVAGIVPFYTTVSLPVYGLSAGTYSYDVNGVTGIFELARDNVAFVGDCSLETGGLCSYTGDLIWDVTARPYGD